MDVCDGHELKSLRFCTRPWHVPVSYLLPEGHARPVFVNVFKGSSMYFRGCKESGCFLAPNDLPSFALLCLFVIVGRTHRNGKKIRRIKEH